MIIIACSFLQPNPSVLFYVEAGEKIVMRMCKNFCAQWVSTQEKVLCCLCTISPITHGRNNLALQNLGQWLKLQFSALYLALRPSENESYGKYLFLYQI